MGIQQAIFQGLVSMSLWASLWKIYMVKVKKEAKSRAIGFRMLHVGYGWQIVFEEKLMIFFQKSRSQFAKVSFNPIICLLERRSLVFSTLLTKLNHC